MGFGGCLFVVSSSRLGLCYQKPRVPKQGCLQSFPLSWPQRARSISPQNKYSTAINRTNGHCFCGHLMRDRPVGVSWRMATLAWASPFGAANGHDTAPLPQTSSGFWSMTTVFPFRTPQRVRGLCCKPPNKGFFVGWGWGCALRACWRHSMPGSWQRQGQHQHCAVLIPTIHPHWVGRRRSTHSEGIPGAG